MKTLMFGNKNVECVSLGRSGSITTCGLGIDVWHRHLGRESHTVNVGSPPDKEDILEKYF